MSNISIMIIEDQVIVAMNLEDRITKLGYDKAKAGCKKIPRAWCDVDLRWVY